MPDFRTLLQCDEWKHITLPDCKTAEQCGKCDQVAQPYILYT